MKKIILCSIFAICIVSCTQEAQELSILKDDV